MAFVPPKDRVKEYSTSNSQTVFAVTGAIDLSHNAFSASMSVGDTTIGGVVERGVAFRSGILTYSATNQITVSTTKETKGTFSSGGTKEVFMGQPALAALMVDGAQTLNAAQKAQLRSNVSSASIAAMAQHNVVVNPAVDSSQELSTTGATLVNNTAKYTADQWEGMYKHTAATAVVTSAKVALPVALAGFEFGQQIKATTAISAPANTDFGKHRQKIEGFRVAHWGWGAAGAAAIVVAFQFYSTVSGVALVRLSNSAGDRFYYHEITVAAGWNFYGFSVAGDTSGTWLKDSGIGLNFEVFSSGKETTPGTSFDTWGATAKIQTTNSTNLLGTANNLTIVTGVYIDVGLLPPAAADLPALMRPVSDDIILCQRYWGSLLFSARFVPPIASAQFMVMCSWVPMRAAPTVTLINSSRSNIVTAIGQNPYPEGTGVAMVANLANTDTYCYGETLTRDARL